MTKLNRSEIMTSAWRIKRNLNIEFGVALSNAWANYKKANASVEELNSLRLTAKRVGNQYELTITNVDFNFTLKRVRNFDGSKYDASTKKWFVPVENAYQVERFMRNY